MGRNTNSAGNLHAYFLLCDNIFVALLILIHEIISFISNTMGGVLAKTKFNSSQCATSLTERFPDKGP